MLTYLLDRRGDRPAYEYLSQCIREDILAGRLRPEEKLPSKRTLARRLGVSVTTVQNAYAQLIAEGYLRPEERRGYFINPVSAAPTPDPPPPEPEPPEEAPRPPVFLDLRSGGVEGSRFPFTLWAKLIRQALAEEGEALLKPVPFNGVPALGKAIADYLYRARGISVRPEQVVLGAGTEYLYHLLVQLLGRDKVYGVEDPGYAKIARVYRACGVAVEELPLDRQGLDPEALEQSRVQVLHLSPSHHYPTGLVTPVGRRQALLDWAGRGEERYIIEDDYDSEFRFVGRPIPTLQSIDTTRRVIYANTFSRTIAPSLRVGYLVLPLPLLERFRRELGFYACTVPSLEQYTLARFLSDGGFERHIGRMRTFYRAKRDRVIAAIRQSSLGPRCAIREADAGLHFLLELDTSRPDQEVEALAEAAGVRLSFLSDYTRRPERVRPHCLVVNYAGLDLERLPQALELLAQFIL
jgi:GntR family transcriptional regulator/MocR family aminotransferase